MGTVAWATAHCLLGCSIGEIIGLMVGVALGMGLVAIMVLDTSLALVTGMALSVIPVVRREKVAVRQALAMIWLGEVVSILVMEVAMNAVDLAVGGIQVNSIWTWNFWLGFIVALPAGFVAAFPVNWWMIRRGLKKCHTH